MKWLYIEELYAYLARNKKRTAIAIAGIALGVLTLVLMSGISGAMRQKTLQELGTFGSRLIVIAPGDLIVFGHKSATLGNVQTLTISDAVAIRDKIESVEGIALMKNAMLPVSTKKRLEPREIIGVDSAFFSLLDFTFLCGGTFTDFQKVAVIGSQTTKDFFDTSCPLGQHICIAKIPFAIRGVLAPRGNIGMEDYDSTLFIPIRVMQRLLTKSNWLDGIFVLSKSSDQNRFLIKQISDLLQKRHGKKDFSVMEYEVASTTSTKMEQLFSILSIIVATIAYSVGILGIIAIMALSVYERVIEIAIKRVVGARKTDIFGQFLLESTILSMAGAVLGTGVALILLFLIEYIAHWPWFIPIQTLIIATMLSIIIGIIASLYPAFKAISLEPLKILKLYEEG
ncbi:MULTISPECIES: ABC transporter permease [unclassified Nitratiruptor]|uniref:ABC transporter permease n=1 Tax=unclassified Nitratiruptor TaxID=2624044 RepID=UPI0019154AAD|nr:MULTISPECIES: ABC transporter permease [unclassified Nitratiruptor]BCD60975.1 putative ABC transport system permease protein [Nitratiruptor sp. YY08-10]BCD64907.1 putative ABC transport system permease protein [Nitratiruptor sp. YY08-14]